MRKQRHVLALVIGAGLTAACLLAAGPMAASDQGSWPASKVSAPTPKVASMPAALARNLANFDDLDFHDSCEGSPTAARCRHGSRGRRSWPGFLPTLPAYSRPSAWER